MRKLLLAVVSVILLSTIAKAQTSSLKGVVTDSVDKKSLENTVISLLREKDSALVKFARAGNTGNFLLSNIRPGNYVLMITHPYVGDYFDKVEIKADVVTDLGKV